MSHRDDQYNGSELAIIGISCRVPGARNPEEFWKNLREGVESVSFLKDEELELSHLDRADFDDPNYVKAASVLEDVELFDAGFFGLSPREADVMDPQHRLFLECAWEALEDAGYDPKSYQGLIGVYAGARTNTYLFNLFSNREAIASLGSFEVGLGNDLAFLPTQVSYKLDLKGPSYAVHTACSTSLVAVHLACQSLLMDECQLALAGGVAVNVPQRTGYLYQPGGIVSPDGHCRAFDARAQGTVFGSGVGIVVLKRLEDALEDGDSIHAVIKGSATNNDGALKASFTAPSVYQQSEVIMEAQANAGVDPETISYVEAHGTGTPLGDPIEVRALTKAFRAKTDKKGFCAIGSVKTNLGHLDAAAGIVGLIKTVLALKHRQLPASLHYEEPNPQIDFAGSPFYVNSRLEDWSSPGEKLRAGVSAFGVGGTNAHVILEEAPEREPGRALREYQLLTLSARSRSALERASRNLARHLREREWEELADVAYTLQVGRRRMSHRRIVVCRDVGEAIGRLESEGETTWGEREGEAPWMVWMFPGQGSQYVNMGRQLYEEEREYRSQVDRCAEVLKEKFGYDLRSVLYPPLGEEVAEREAEEALSETRMTQPALFVVEYAMAKQMERWGLKPEAMIGHSTGEYVAACLSGVMTVEDALWLVGRTGQMRERYGDGLEELKKRPGMLFVEVGPGDGLSRLARREGVPEGAIVATMRGEREIADDREKLVRALGRLWEAGVEIDWNGYHDGERLRRVSLPTYPFERQRHWINAGSPKANAAFGSEPSGKRKDVSEWFYVPGWRRRELPRIAGPAAEGDKKRTFLLMEGCGGLSRCLAERLKREAARVIRVRAGASFRKVGEDEYEIRAGERQDYDDLLRDSASAGASVTNVVFTWTLCERQDPPEERFVRAQERGFYSLLFLAQALAGLDSLNQVRIDVISDRMQQVSGEEDISPEKATLLAACKVIPQEILNISCRSIDIVQPPPESDEEARITNCLISEIDANSPEIVVAYRGGRRWVQSFEHLRLESGARSLRPLRVNGVYLITGGLGEVGLLIAEHLAKTVQARLILTGRSHFPERSEWAQWVASHRDDDEISIKIGRLQAMEAAGAEVTVERADVADEDRMRALVKGILRRHRALHGVMHAAGVTSGPSVFTPMTQIGPAEVESQFRPKAHGVLVLERVLRDLELDFCLLFSSNASVLGGLGLIAYAAANTFMDAFASSRNTVHETPGRMPWISATWDPWPEEMKKYAGYRITMDRYAMTAEESVEAFRRLVTLAPKGQVVVATGDLRERLDLWIKRAASLSGRRSGDESSPHPRPDIDRPYVAPRNDLEQTIAGIWQEVLSLERVGVDDDFFKLGGHSLLAIELVSRLRDLLRVELPVGRFFQSPTVAGTAQAISDIEGKSRESEKIELLDALQ
jgi:acyl transferase domain-containing protein/acyl carrier protein